MVDTADKSCVATVDIGVWLSAEITTDECPVYRLEAAVGTDSDLTIW